MLVFNSTKLGLLNRTRNLMSGTYYYHLVTTAPTDPAATQVSQLAIATGGNYAPAVLGAVPTASLVNNAGALLTQAPTWNLLTIGGGNPIVGSVLCHRAGASPAATDPPIVYNPLPSPYSPNGSDFSLSIPSNGILRLGDDYLVTNVTATTVTITVTHAVSSNAWVGQSAIFSNLPGSSYLVQANTASSNNSVTLTLQATNLVTDGVTTTSRLRLNGNGLIFNQVSLGLLDRSLNLSTGTFYSHLVTATPTDPTLTQVSQLTLAAGGNYAPVLLSNLSSTAVGNTAIWRSDDPVWANLTTNLAANIRGMVVCRRTGGSFANTDPIICFKPVSLTQFPGGYVPNGATFTAQTNPSTQGLLRFL